MERLDGGSQNRAVLRTVAKLPPILYRYPPARFLLPAIMSIVYHGRAQPLVLAVDSCVLIAEEKP